MRKGRIFRYELKRLFFSREYLLLLAAAIVYSVSLLRGSVIFGTMYTAPFSQWTYCSYCAALAPLMLILLLVLCARQLTASEHGAIAITSATPMPVPIFKLLRYSAIALAYLTPVILSATLCLVFYWQVFDFTSFGPLIWSGILLFLPPSIFVFGAAMLLGERKGTMVYFLLAVVLTIGVFHISLPSCVDLIGSSVTIPLFSGEQYFAFTSAFITGRIAFFSLGIVLIYISLMQAKTRSCKA